MINTRTQLRRVLKIVSLFVPIALAGFLVERQIVRPGTVQAVATATLVVVTIIYALFTRQGAKASEVSADAAAASLRLQTTPYVQAGDVSVSGSHFGVHVMNYGPAHAFNLRTVIAMPGKDVAWLAVKVEGFARAGTEFIAHVPGGHRWGERYPSFFVCRPTELERPVLEQRARR